MKILGIESSCDESAVALIEIEHNSNNKQALHSGDIIQKRILDQYITTHNNHNYGGIIPESVARQHYYYLPKMIARLKDKYDLNDIDMICAAHAPGLIGGLMLGTCAGKAIATALQKPFYPIHHIEGHVLSAAFENNGLGMPYICLIASGGHTLLAIVEDFGKYRILGQSADDAMGELFDKVAKYLGLPFPGGPEVERLASLGTPKYTLPIPRIKDNEFGFSFSGLKTAIIRLIHEVSNANNSNNSHHISHASAESQNSYEIQSENVSNMSNTHSANISTDTIHIFSNNSDISAHSIQANQHANIINIPAMQTHTHKQQYEQSTTSINTLSQTDIQDICASVQHTVVQLCKQKFSATIREFPHINHYVMAGGVGANKAIRSALDQLMYENNKKFFVPEMKLCTDNALMIAWTGYLSFLYDRKPNLTSGCMNTKSITEITKEYYPI